MSKAKVTFHKCVQDSQDYGSTDDHMVSRLFFSLEEGGKRHDGLHVNVKQAVGSDFETGPLEVGPPVGYDGPFDQQAFQQVAENYYRGCVGSKGSGIKIVGARNVRMRNNTFNREAVSTFEID